MPKLVFHDSDGVDKTLQLGAAEITIGRASDCEVQTHDAMVSRKHARITWDGGSYWVEDLGSSNGVFLGQDKVQRAQFRPGDVLTCGSLVIRMVPETRRSQVGDAFEPPPPRSAPVEAPPPSRTDAPRQDARRPPPTTTPPDWDQPMPTSANPALAAVGRSDGELKQLRANLRRETERREQAEAALLTAEQRVTAADESGRELAQLRRKVDQRDAEIRRLQEQVQSASPPTAQSASPLDLDEVGESVALFNDALAEVKAHLRAAIDEGKLLSSPSDSVQVVRDSLRGALDELEHARARLREMVRNLGLPEA